jgi:hypothetical protein
MSIVKAEKAMKKMTKKIAFLFWSEEDAIMNNSHPLFFCTIIIMNSPVKKNHLQWNRFGPSDAVYHLISATFTDL